jgi:hypothetical protein
MRSGKNLTGSTILAKRFLAPDGTNPGQIRLPAAVTTFGEGVTTEDIPDGFTGSYQRDGIAIVTCSAAVNAGAYVQSGTDGRAATAATNSQIRGVAKNTTGGSGEDLEVELHNGRSIAP